ncbi:ferrichrome ABC transporter permease [Anoxybacillus sp. UARK-01]|uniref:FecCD family ABC transporter permease n=1 Tax=Anoxybacillus sp. UARK-01 TaxID=1895648 RepID=UPI0009BB9B33|nr:iron ABC transporter permease [Anoxybacillus sp. UARK-01]OQM45289.1 ferrichrome ABC transporter permease [Anoxybacillus sp. UARK-01]
MTIKNSAQSTTKALHNHHLSGIAILLFGSLLLLFFIIASIHVGAADLRYSTIWKALFHFNSDHSSHVIIRELRLPRAIAAVLVGAALATSGAIMQGMTRNPLASPSIMGVSAGSAFLVAIAIAFLPGISYYGLIFFSFVGAGVGAGLVFGIASLSKGGMTPVKLALAGSAITGLLSSLSTAIGIKYNVSKDLSYWYAGGVAGVQMQHLHYLTPFVLGGLILAVILSRSITILSLGEEISKGLGQNTRMIKLLGTIVVLLLTGAAVSIAGMIGFVGLVIPHITRFLTGADYRWIIPCSAILGGILLIVADIVGRMINPPFETPVGAITALVGVPFFLYLARKEGREL